MNHAQCSDAAKAIISRYLNGVEPKQHHQGLTRQHLRWMCEQIATLSEAKAMRWLGYVQGVLVAWGVATLTEMKELSRDAVYPTAPEETGR